MLIHAVIDHSWCVDDPRIDGVVGISWKTSNNTYTACSGISSE